MIRNINNHNNQQKPRTLGACVNQTKDNLATSMNFIYRAYLLEHEVTCYLKSLP